MNILDFAKKKQLQQKITMVTCYDYTSARLLAETAVDCILVGDSAAMTMHGFANTISASVEMMAAHTAAVVRGAPQKMIIGDLPFLSYRQSLAENVAAVKQLMQSGAQAIKLEGAAGNLELIHHLVESGVPMMGHLGLTPQSVHALGGYKVQGKTAATEKKLLEEAKALEQAGCFAVVLECVPHTLASEITAALSIPTIGIGAGNGTDGQVLVWQDLLGLNLDFKPKFVKHFVDAGALIQQGVRDYIHAVNTGAFPDHEHHY
ncbi:MAG: 3-methyl-2-oxobutanoate hydroxymethyltransferase [Gammaproteobacteria bacterium]|jgi:3-methyl-2-oxobutanoate hydroxymethyltransferase|nr:3-methyl-2-oxobutanoate hydroxymethyltransferase [Gammaproteobacteria bacterium]